jgi:serine/threonine-protein kinase
VTTKNECDTQIACEPPGVCDNRGLRDFIWGMVMAQPLRCPQGHEWTASAGEATPRCPVCAAAPMPAGPGESATDSCGTLKFDTNPASQAKPTPSTKKVTDGWDTLPPESLPKTPQVQSDTAWAASHSDDNMPTVAPQSPLSASGDDDEKTHRYPTLPQPGSASATDAELNRTKSHADSLVGHPVNDDLGHTGDWTSPPTDADGPTDAPTVKAKEPAANQNQAPVDAARSDTSKTIPMKGPDVGLAGLKIPNYQILSELGRGGMGVVYKARQVGLNRVVALKMVLTAGHASESDLIRFRLEAEAVAKVQHPNITQVYDIGEHEGRPFFSLEFIDGGPLDKKIKSEPQPPRQAARLMEDIARAVHFAHERNIIHRDLKPANVLVTKDGVPKITDFGLAKNLGEDVGQTGTGQVLGTPTFMAPEQAAGRVKELGPAADIYSLGAMLYDMLTGRPPLRGETVLDTLLMVQNEEPLPPRRLVPKIPADLETICLKCLHKDARRRYASAGALADDLHRFLNNEPIEARPTPAWERTVKWARRNPTRAALATVSGVLVLALTAGGFLFARYERSRAEREADLRLEAEQQRDRAEEQERIARQQEQLATEARDRAEKERRRAELNFQKAREAVDQMLTRVGQDDLSQTPQADRVRRDLLARAAAYYQDFAKEKGGDVDVRSEAARAVLRLGDIHEMLKQPEAAEKAYRDGLARLTEIAAAHPDQPEYRRDLAAGHNNLAILLHSAGRSADADKEYAAAFAIKEKLVAEHKNDPGYLLDLGRALNNRGLRLQTTGRIADAETAYRRGLDILDRACGVADCRDLRATLLLNLAASLQVSGKAREAEATHRQAQALREELAQQHPDSPDHGQELARTILALATLQQLAGRGDDADATYRDGIARLEKLASLFPDRPDLRLDLAVGCNNLAALYLAGGRLKDAEMVWRRAIDVLAKLGGKSDSLPVYRKEWAKALHELGLLLARINRWNDAEDALRKAIALQERLANDSPSEPILRQDLARSHGNLGLLLSMVNRHDRAEESYRRAVDLAESLAETPMAVVDLVGYLAKLGTLQSALGKNDEAEVSRRRVVELQRQRFAKEAKSVARRQDVAFALGDLAETLGKRQRRTDARIALEEAVRLETEAVAMEPRQITFSTGLAELQLRLLDVLVQLEDHASADRTAANLLDAGPPQWPKYHLAATVLARCLPLVESDDKLQPDQRKDAMKAYSDHAVQLLRKAVGTGFKDAEKLKSSSDLKPLLGRPDVQKLLADIEGKSKS